MKVDKIEYIEESNQIVIIINGVEYECPVIGCGYEAYVVENPLNKAEVVKIYKNSLIMLPLKEKTFAKKYSSDLQELFELLQHLNEYGIGKYTPIELILASDGFILGYTQKKFENEYITIKDLHNATGIGYLAFAYKLLEIYSSYKDMCMVDIDINYGNYIIEGTELNPFDFGGKIRRFKDEETLNQQITLVLYRLITEILEYIEKIMNITYTRRNSGIKQRWQRTLEILNIDNDISERFISSIDNFDINISILKELLIEIITNTSIFEQDKLLLNM